MRVVLTGPSGGGKELQALIIKERYGVCHLDCAALFVDVSDPAADFGGSMRRVVDDEVAMKTLLRWTQQPQCAKGFVLEGAPRSLRQAQLMEKVGIKPDKVIDVAVVDGVIVDRSGGRWVHAPSGRIYHSTENPPVRFGVDDITGGSLVQRPADQRKAITEELECYHAEVDPVLAFYRSRGLVETVDGGTLQEEIRAKVEKILDPLYRAQLKPWYKFW